jgi:large subunit ribosomal protein L24
MSLLKREDLVEVISGEDKGKRGRVIGVDRTKQRVTIQGVNLVYKHLRRTQKHPQGGRIQMEAPVHISNVMLVDPKADHPVRVKMAVDKSGKRRRVSAKSDNPV